MAHPSAKDCMMPMGWTSENVALDFDISRDDMDAFAALSFQRAEHAQQTGLFDKEVVPFRAYVKDPATGVKTKTTVTRDDGIRPGTTKESLAKIKSAFPQWGRGQTTGGNASQITDGAAAVMMMSRRKAQELGLDILGKWVTTSVNGMYFLVLRYLPNPSIHRSCSTGYGDRSFCCHPSLA
jgi:acetyl-CoA acyltransferase 1